ncbi:MAG: DUF4097 family beta strand repeat-containing protein [Lactovum sp.]
MTEKKERILDLMRKGIITNEEAIELLEKTELNLTNALEESRETTKNKKENPKEDGFDHHKVDVVESLKTIGGTVKGGLTDVFKDISKTVDKNIDFSKGMPKVRTAKKVVEQEFSEDFESVSLSLKTGKVEICQSESSKIEIEYKIYGSVSDLDKYLEENTEITITEGKLDITVHGRLSVNILLKLSPKDYKAINLEALNAAVIIEGLSIQELTLSSKNGNFELTDIKTKTLNLDLINGDIKFNGSFIDGKASLTNGSLRVTQLDSQAKNLKVKNINGDIKLSVPENLALTGHMKTVFGSYKTRLRLDQPFESSKSGAVIVRSGEESLTFDLDIKSGTIWLKDGE